MPKKSSIVSLLVLAVVWAQETVPLPRAFIDGSGPDWKELTEQDFADVNGDPETWTWKDGVVTCTGRPIGVLKTVKQYTNFEFVAQWRHLKPAGNSGFFLWAPPAVLEGLAPDKLPAGGIEGGCPGCRGK